MLLLTTCGTRLIMKNRAIMKFDEKHPLKYQLSVIARAWTFPEDISELALNLLAKPYFKAGSDIVLLVHGPAPSSTPHVGSRSDATKEYHLESNCSPYMSMPEL